MVKILFVCLGNICRSPTAEGVFRHHSQAAGLKDGYRGDLFIDSAGTAGYHTGAKPDPRSRETAEKHGVSLDDLGARAVTLQDFTDFDYILAMDMENLKNLQQECPEEHLDKIQLFMSFAPDCPGITEVPDPYYFKGLDGFERVFDFINRASLGLLSHISEKHNL